MIFLKFGKKDHLEKLKQGQIHFRPIEYFRKEPTKFRGDDMEGSIYLDLCKPLLINGTDYSPYISKAVLSCRTDGNTLSFSSSMLSKEICQINEKGTYSLRESYISEMSQFGEYVLLFNGDALIASLLDFFESNRCTLKYHSILYCDKEIPAEIREVFTRFPNEDELLYYFIKDKTYCLQNEWRMVLFDVNNKFFIGENGGVDIETEFSSNMPIFKVEDLSTLECSEEFLC